MLHDLTDVLVPCYWLDGVPWWRLVCTISRSFDTCDGIHQWPDSEHVVKCFSGMTSLFQKCYQKCWSQHLTRPHVQGLHHTDNFETGFGDMSPSNIQIAPKKSHKDLDLAYTCSCFAWQLLRYVRRLIGVYISLWSHETNRSLWSRTVIIYQAKDMSVSICIWSLRSCTL